MINFNIFLEERKINSYLRGRMECTVLPDYSSIQKKPEPPPSVFPECKATPIYNFIELIYSKVRKF